MRPHTQKARLVRRAKRQETQWHFIAISGYKGSGTHLQCSEHILRTGRYSVSKTQEAPPHFHQHHYLLCYAYEALLKFNWLPVWTARGLFVRKLNIQWVVRKPRVITLATSSMGETVLNAELSRCVKTEGRGYGIICGTVGSECKLMRVVVLYVLQEQFLK